MSWRDRFPDRATCVRCLETRDITDLDRLFWCHECRGKARERARRKGWIWGVASAGFLAVYIWLVIQPSSLILGGWIATVVAALWLIARIAREVLYGVERYRNRRAVEATPPTGAPEGEAEEDGDPENPFGWRRNRG